MKASIGRIILYVLGEGDVSQIESRRAASGAYVGNIPRAGQVVPAIVVAAWGGEDDKINGQAVLDGLDSHWITLRAYDAAKTPGTWHWPERVAALEPPKTEPKVTLKTLEPVLLQLCRLIEACPASTEQSDAAALATNLLFAVSMINRDQKIGHHLEQLFGAAQTVQPPNPQQS